MNKELNTLTDFEVAGLNSIVCLADGHAYQDMHPAFQSIIEDLPDIWRNAAKISVPMAEKQFNAHYANFINSDILQDYEHFRICPTASNTIDIVGAVLKMLQVSVTMVEPTFDNLSLLLRRRNVQLFSVSDQLLFEAAEADQLETLFSTSTIGDALFLVNPNNPTGLTISENAFKNIIAFCAKHQKLLIIDNCFRIYKRKPFDDYRLLIDSSISFIAFEDTGKVWPTQDLKASLVYFSKDLASIFNEIYNEVYLCVSNFSLAILSRFFQETMLAGVRTTIWDVIDTRRLILREALENSNLKISSLSINSKLPVEWIEIIDYAKNDFEVCQELHQRNLAVLPGRQFYWNSSTSLNNHKNIRISLMKTEEVFLSGIQILLDYCGQLSSSCHQWGRNLNESAMVTA